MTDADKPAFAAAMNRLGIALRETEPDAVRLRVYFEALKSLELEFIVMAARALEQTADWFPKTSEWYDAAVKVQHDRTEQLISSLRHRSEPWCLACADTTWVRDEATNRVSRCDCLPRRRMIILGRQPMPALPEAL